MKVVHSRAEFFDAREQLGDECPLRGIRSPFEHRDFDDRVVDASVLRIDEVLGIERNEPLELLLGRVLQRDHDRLVDRLRKLRPSPLERFPPPVNHHLSHSATLPTRSALERGPSMSPLCHRRRR